MGIRMTPEELYFEEMKWIQEYARTSRTHAVAIGISGGKDSAVAAALCANAIGPARVFGYMLPDGVQSDIMDSVLVCKKVGIVNNTCNIGYIHKEFLDAIQNGAGITVSNEADINIAPRIRMTVLYAIAQSRGQRVCGTGNLSEALVGYTTKWGDQACDFNPLGGLTSIEVQQLGKYMGLASHVKCKPPLQIVDKVPADGLCGKSDEEKLGVSYQDIHDYLLGNIDNISKDTIHKIEYLSRRGEHKRLHHIPMFWPKGTIFDIKD